ncbi:hypothetical protein H4S07_003805 [Coemansia furcata]|uniref:Uncharacterized protein n=1 Tax=Coemansia furcata TaxID=417177 RepID=A0ACC1LFA5_9FUNG|nr:hypothetical protein H4S07_003805 [Coemansia furcata]
MRTEHYRIRKKLIVKYTFLEQDEVRDYVGYTGQFIIVKHTFDDEEVYKIIRDFHNAESLPDLSDLNFAFVNLRTSQPGWRFEPKQPHAPPDYYYYLDGQLTKPPPELEPLLDVSDISIATHFDMDVS